MMMAALLVNHVIGLLPEAASTTLPLDPTSMTNATTIMAVGDSITFGCGYQAKPPGYGLQCSGGDASYRAKLYELLTAAGQKVQFVGRAKSGSGADFPVEQWMHEGYSGQRIDQLDEKLYGASPWAGVPPDVMLVMLGTNDIWHLNSTTATMKKRMDSFLNHTFARMGPKTKVFLASITNMAGRVNLTDCDPVGTSNCPGHDGNPLGHSCCCGCRTYWPPMVAGLNAMLKQQVLSHKAAGQDITFVDLFGESKVCSSATSPEANDCCHSYHVHPTRTGYEKIAAVWFKYVHAALSQE
jgi:lysophospholipase L1-like esterase